MDRIYEDAKDLHVRGICFYGKKADHKLYYDPEYTTQVLKADAIDAFKKRALMVINGDIFTIPVAVNGAKVITLDKTGEPSEEFSASSTYSVGDVVLKSGKAYKCKTAIATAGAWDATKWDEIVTVDFVEWATKVSA